MLWKVNESVTSSVISPLFMRLHPFPHLRYSNRLPFFIMINSSEYYLNWQSFSHSTYHSSETTDPFHLLLHLAWCPCHPNYFVVGHINFVQPSVTSTIRGQCFSLKVSSERSNAHIWMSAISLNASSHITCRTAWSLLQTIPTRLLWMRMMMISMSKERDESWMSNLCHQGPTWIWKQKPHPTSRNPSPRLPYEENLLLEHHPLVESLFKLLEKACPSQLRKFLSK